MAQGSVIGPVIFNYFVNDMHKFLKTQTAIHADDTAFIAHSFNAQMATFKTQIHLNLILDYTKKWEIKLNENKTEHIIFTRKLKDTKINTPLQINKIKIKPKH